MVCGSGNRTRSDYPCNERILAEYPRAGSTPATANPTNFPAPRITPTAPREATSKAEDQSYKLTVVGSSPTLPTAEASHVLVIYDLAKPAEALQTQYVKWAMEALPCDWDCAGAAGVWRFIRDGAHVSFCESGQQPNKEGLLKERSIFQVHRIHTWRFERLGWTWHNAWNPVKNIRIAWDIHQDAGGWTPWWHCRRSIP